jgi:hypothetical protein
MADSAINNLVTNVSNAFLIEAPSANTRIGGSHITGAERGVFAAKNIPAGVDLFRHEPLVMTVSTEQEGKVCDWCHAVAIPSQYLDAQGYLPADEHIPNVRKCMGCKFVAYCSKVINTICSSHVDS